jgi:flagellin
MSRINTNVTSLIAQSALNTQNSAVDTSLQRLSTGLQINSGADNPSGLIASENLKAEQSGLNTAINNANLATNVIGTAEGGLSEVSNLLVELQGLVSQSANTGALSSAEVSANQLQVDSILSTVNRIAGATSFQGSKLLNGNYAYTTSSTSAVNNLQINAATLVGGATQPVVVSVVTSAQTATLGFASNIPTNGPSTIQVAGEDGTQQLSFASGTTASEIVTAINGVTDSTGVSASLSGTDLRLDSTDLGAQAFVSVTDVAGTFSAGESHGRDAAVLINGAAAEAQGNNITYNGGGLDVSFQLSNTLNVNGGTTTFGITGGGANFQLGDKVTSQGIASIGIQSVSTGSLGDNTTGFLTSLGSGGANSLSSTNLITAQSIITSAISQVSELRGRLGAFQTYTLGSTINSLGVAYENASSAESDIADTDFASETSNLTRAQVLQSAATSVLSTANSQPQNALKLLQNL